MGQGGSRRIGTKNSTFSNFFSKFVKKKLMRDYFNILIYAHLELFVITPNSKPYFFLTKPSRSEIHYITQQNPIYFMYNIQSQFEFLYSLILSNLYELLHLFQLQIYPRAPQSDSLLLSSIYIKSVIVIVISFWSLIFVDLVSNPLATVD